MSTQLLIYERAVPLSSQRHKGWSVKTGADYAFARQVNSVPLVAVEFPHAAAEYSIVFAGNDEAMMPVVILGMRENENLYLNESNAWTAKYIPAFIRRYPFVFSSNEDQSTFTLCIDEEFAGYNQEGRGEHLFDADGERTQYLENVLRFVNDYQGQYRRTQLFCKKLQELDLLEPMQAQFTLNSGQQLRLAGFKAVNRERLKNLSDEQVAALFKTDELELIYLHLQSMKNFSAMVEKTAAHIADHQEAAKPAVDEAAAPSKEELH
ncbi:SapC family protein [Methylicorpusculum oleiharenae]|uniref:SapC family protein n=1 Tax=Methylicorpusculum oleiharenae TaxID=1338687 RepID=UPI00135AC457|nr:SapC family protein [Methylicorpusculum oleiharenae]MCD2452319.1 SapC family protein [Methylicorpusculum oleiharenae]